MHKMVRPLRKLGKPDRSILFVAILLWACAAVAVLGSCSGIGSDIPPASVLVSGQATLSWEGFPGATTYIVYLSRSPGVSRINTYGIRDVTPPVTFTGLEPGATYYLMVIAVTASSESDASKELSFTVGDAPGFVDFKTIFRTPVPESKIENSADNQLTLTWDDMAGASSYNVYLKNSPGVTTRNGRKLADVKNPCTIKGLQKSATYYFVVTAITESGESDASKELSFTVEDSSGFVDFKTIFSIPVPKSKIKKSADGQVTLAWDNVTGADTYNVYWKTSPGVTKKTGKKVTNAKNPCTIKGLQKGATYWFVVTAVNKHGESGVSNEISATVD